MNPFTQTPPEHGWMDFFAGGGGKFTHQEPERLASSQLVEIRQLFQVYLPRTSLRDEIQFFPVRI